MTSVKNPFMRGYQKLNFHRMLLITHKDDCPPVYRALHPSQAHLPDSQICQFPCIFSDDFALITEGQDISADLDNQAQYNGLVRAVIYSIEGTDATGNLAHVGDAVSSEEARMVIQNLAFNTGHFSRCWEISTGHLCDDAKTYLNTWANHEFPIGLMFELFRIPCSEAYGIKLFSTPWTDDNLSKIDEADSEHLRQEQLNAGVPASLVSLLYLAAQADTRILIFDPDAPILPDLPFFED
ncbi:ABC transporter substrate-binding protein [Serratia fonticola]|uniref:DUF5983 family protein n=1 Tax=Serratia fonticola TaxID=47917 RepID=UPI00192C218D|nr:ABC transporter substrate-binding protein [Serratia fonticola]MBL5862090.1 ABC transporter substrate-binding protein [Serratia fonticola]